MDGLKRSVQDDARLRRRIYLAGPDVFHPGAIEIGARKKALCHDHGFTGLFPLDGGDATADPAAIYANCLAMMRQADAGVFNLTPFRGPSADVGTVFELGFMASLGKPVFAYTNDAADLVRRVPAVTRRDDIWVDADGLSVEDFGHSDNLMLDETLALQGRRIHRRAVPMGSRFLDLSAFELCLVEAQRVFAR